MSYLKPQTPIELGGNYIYPLTTADQVIVSNGNRLNSLFKKTIQENIILRAYNWSESAPYTQTITLTESVDDYKVDANVMYNGNENDSALNKAAGCLSYIKKNRKEITFYCLKNKPEIDIPVEITGTCRNTIATVENGIKLNFNIKAYGSEEEMLADTPLENTIGVVTDVPISGYKFSVTEPENMKNGEVWISTGISNKVSIDIVDGVTVYPIFAKQMVSGVLVDLEAKIWQNGVWHDLNSIEYVLKDGAFTKGDWGSHTSNQYLGTVSFGTGLIHFDVDGEASCTFYTTEKFDTTGKTELVFVVPKMVQTSIDHPGGKLRFGISSQKDSNSYVTEVRSIVKHNTVLQEVIVPITPEYYGEFYIKVTLDKSATPAYRNHLYISEIRLQ